MNTQKSVGKRIGGGIGAILAGIGVWIIGGFMEKIIPVYILPSFLVQSVFAILGLVVIGYYGYKWAIK